MKKITAVLCLLAMLLSLAACGKTNGIEVPMGFQLASDTSVTDYTLFLPSDWTVNYQTGMTSAYYNEADPSSISLTTFDASEVADIDDYWAQYTKQYSDVFGDPADVQIENATLDGKDARQFIYTTTFGEKEYKIWQVVCLRASRVYILSYVSTAENFEKHEEAMRAVVLDGFRFGTNG